MENNELQKIWKTMETEINYKSKDELNLLLSSKVKQEFTEFLVLTITAIPICVGLIIWLFVSTLKRIEDTLYVTNNILLGIIVLFALFYLIREWNRYNQNKKAKPVKEWIEIEINLLSKWLIGKYRNINFLLIPVMYILTFLSIHVYYSGLSFIEVLRSEKFIQEDMWGILIFTPLILVGMYYSLIKLRKHQIKKFRFLKDLYRRLCNVR